MEDLGGGLVEKQRWSKYVHISGIAVTHPIRCHAHAEQKQTNTKEKDLIVHHPPPTANAHRAGRRTKYEVIDI